MKTKSKIKKSRHRCAGEAGASTPNKTFAEGGENFFILGKKIFLRYGKVIKLVKTHGKKSRF